MASAIKATDVQDKAPARAAQAKAKVRKQAREDISFDGKTFDSLNGQEKDDLLKLLAVQAGIIVE